MSGNNVQFYDFNLSAGGSQWLPVSGAFYRIISSTGPVSIREDVGTTVGPISAGQGMRNRDFGGLTISDKSGAANKGTIIVAGSDFVDDRITGEVSTIDGGKARSVAGSAYASYAYQTASAGNYAFNQLWNKSANRRLIVNAIILGSNAAQTAHIRNTAATINAATLNVGVNKGQGSDSSAADVRIASNASFTAFGGANAVAIFVQANTVQRYQPTEPWVVPPGAGIVLAGSGVGCDLGTSFEWWEEMV